MPKYFAYLDLWVSKSSKPALLYYFREPLVIFSGGMSYDRAGRTPCITVMTGKTTTVLEMEYNVVDFVVLCETPWQNGKLKQKKIVSIYDQEIPQSQTADKPMAPRGRTTQPLRDSRKTNQAKQPALSSPSRWLQNYTMHNKLSGIFLCSSLCSADQFQLQWREQDFRQMKPWNFRRHLLNRHLGRARIAEGVSEQKSHPL